MIKLIFKCSIAFIVSFIVLSMPISDKPVFYHLSELTGPLGGDIQKSFSKSLKRSVSKTKKMSSKLFSNSNPPKVKDRVKSRQSSILNKRRNRIKSAARTSEELHHQDKKKLDNLIAK